MESTSFFLLPLITSAQSPLQRMPMESVTQSGQFTVLTVQGQERLGDGPSRSPDSADDSQFGHTLNTCLPSIQSFRLENEEKTSTALLGWLKRIQ